MNTRSKGSLVSLGNIKLSSDTAQEAGRINRVTQYRNPYLPLGLGRARCQRPDASDRALSPSAAAPAAPRWGHTSGKPLTPTGKFCPAVRLGDKRTPSRPWPLFEALSGLQDTIRVWVWVSQVKNWRGQPAQSPAGSAPRAVPGCDSSAVPLLKRGKREAFMWFYIYGSICRAGCG